MEHFVELVFVAAIFVVVTVELVSVVVTVELVSVVETVELVEHELLVQVNVSILSSVVVTVALAL